MVKKRLQKLVVHLVWSSIGMRAMCEGSWGNSVVRSVMVETY